MAPPLVDPPLVLVYPQPAEKGASAGIREALWTRDFVLLLAGNALFYMGFQMLLASMPLYAEYLGGGEFAAGLVTGLLTLTAMAVRPLTGWALDAYGRRALWLLSTGFCVLATVATGWVGTLVTLVILRMLYGIGFGVSSTASGTVAADLVPKSRLGEGMGFVAMAMGIPLGIAPALGLWLAGKEEFAGLIWLSAGVTLAALVLAALMRSNRSEPRAVSTDRLRPSNLFEPSALFPAALMFLLIASFGAILALLALFGKERGIAHVGMWFTVYAVLLTLARMGTGKLADHWGYRQVAAAGFVSAGAGLLLLALAQSMGLLLASAVVYGIGYGTAQPSIQAMMVDRSPPARLGAATATLFFAYDLGTTVGSVGGGLLAGVVGLGGVFVVSALGPVVGVVWLLAHMRRSSWPGTRTVARRTLVQEDHRDVPR